MKKKLLLSLLLLFALFLITPKVNAQNKSAAIRYQAHVQNVGWMDKVSDGETAGTTGRNLGVEALKIQLET